MAHNGTGFGDLGDLMRGKPGTTAAKYYSRTRNKKRKPKHRRK